MKQIDHKAIMLRDKLGIEIWPACKTTITLRVKHPSQAKPASRANKAKPANQQKIGELGAPWQDHQCKTSRAKSSTSPTPRTWAHRLNLNSPGTRPLRPSKNSTTRNFRSSKSWETACRGSTCRTGPWKMVDRLQVLRRNLHHLCFDVKIMHPEKISMLIADTLKLINNRISTPRSTEHLMPLLKAYQLVSTSNQRLK